MDVLYIRLEEGKIAEWLAKNGQLHTTTCASFEQARAEVQKEKPNIYIIEGSSSPETLSLFLAETNSTANIPVILLTRSLQMRLAAKSTGVQHILSAHKDGDNLHQRLNDIVAQLVPLQKNNPFSLHDLLAAYATGERTFPGVDLHGCDFQQANLTGIDLQNANLCEANLSGVILKGANLFNANCSYANLSFADLHSANLTNTNFTGADLSMAIMIRTRFRNTILPDGTIR